MVEKEYQVQLDIAMQSGKPKEIAEKMVEGCMKKFTGEVSLTGQLRSLTEPEQICWSAAEKSTTLTLLASSAAEVGEGIENVETDFAAEVAAMSKQS